METVENYIKLIEQEEDHPFPKERQKGLVAFRQWGIPGPNPDIWRYTSPGRYLPKTLSLNTPIYKGKVPTPLFTTGITLVNGRYNPKYSSLPNGVTVKENAPLLSGPPTVGDSFEALNLATLKSTLTITVAPNTSLTSPLCITHFTSKSASGHFLAPHLEIICHKGASLTILEFFTFENGAKSYQHNALSKIELAEGATVEHCKVVKESVDMSLHIGKVKATVKDNANFKSFTLSITGFLVRNNLEINLAREGASTSALGLYPLQDSEHHDHFTSIDHQKGNTRSAQLFKGILRGESRGVFTGKITIAKNASGADSNLLSKSLLLSPKARVNTRPWLAVNTGDVTCTHGATTGQISPDQLFYLQSRGIELAVAQKMLCRAFGAEILNQLSYPLVRQKIEQWIKEKSIL